MFVSFFNYSVTLGENGAEVGNAVAEMMEVIPGQEDNSLIPNREAETENVQLPTSAALQAENYFLRHEVEKLKTEVATMKETFSFKLIEGSDKLILLYTGLPNKEVFKLLFEFCNKFEICYYSGWNVDCVSKENQLFMTLIKLRQNLLHEDLAVRFGVSTATVSNIILTWLHVLHEVLYEGLMANVPSLLKNQTCLPNCFSSFTSCRVIIDCTEVYTAIPTSMGKKQKLYSHYKHRSTLKGLVAVAPNGVVTFASSLYGGSTSDKMITKDCGLLNILNSGDLVLADKGFLISDILPEGVHVNIPPFLETPQFTPEQVLRTRSIARARIHVERAIGRIKGYSILDFVPQTLLPYASKVWQVCAALTNFQYPLLKEVEVFFKPSDTGNS